MATAGRRLGAAVAVGLLVGTVLAPSGAWAGDGVVSANPADRAALSRAPSTVDLRTSAAPDPAASHVTVWDAAGSDLDTAALSDSGGQTLSQPVAIRSTGNFTVAYHVVFTDGHDVIGVLRFSVGTGMAPPVPPAAQQRADQQVALQHEHGIDPLSGSLLVLDVVVVAAVALLLFSNPRRRGAGRPRRSRHRTGYPGSTT